jgi:hypothetical protein
MLVPKKESSTKETWLTFYNNEAAEAFEAFKPERKDGDERVFQTTKQPLNRKFRHVSEEVGVKHSTEVASLVCHGNESMWC